MLYILDIVGKIDFLSKCYIFRVNIFFFKVRELCVVVDGYSFFGFSRYNKEVGK